MAIYNTGSDSANTAVRAFLTKIGEYYWGESFNTGSKKGKKIWNDILIEFNHSCAYCGSTNKLQMEHLIMFNKTECGLHHPGNIVPVCSKCNQSRGRKNGNYVSWEKHLKNIVLENEYVIRKEKIEKHICKYKYPILTKKDMNAIKVIANNLYDNIKNELDKSLKLYKEITEAFIKY